jgi:hypothetical protein
MVRENHIVEYTRRTLKSIEKDLLSGDMWLQSDNGGEDVYLACSEGWQDLYPGMVKRLFDKLSFEKRIYVKGYVSNIDVEPILKPTGKVRWYIR